MKIVTIWEARMHILSNVNEDGKVEPETKLRSVPGHMFYLSQARADDVSAGGPAIERKVLERDGLYFMSSRPYKGEITELPSEPVDETTLWNIQVFTSDEPWGDEISSLPWVDEMARLGRHDVVERYNKLKGKN